MCVVYLCFCWFFSDCIISNMHHPPHLHISFSMFSTVVSWLGTVIKSSASKFILDSITKLLVALYILSPKGALIINVTWTKNEINKKTFFTSDAGTLVIYKMCLGSSGMKSTWIASRWRPIIQFWLVQMIFLKTVMTDWWLKILTSEYLSQINW